MKKWTNAELLELNINETAKIDGAVTTTPGQVCPVCGKEWTGNDRSSSHKGWCTYGLEDEPSA